MTDTNFSCNLLAHSRTPAGAEAFTFETCHERFIHAEFMTHRWARSASSSRAIPYNVMKKQVMDDPALPLHYGANQKGMQSGAEIDRPLAAELKIIAHMYDAIAACDVLYATHGLHKEIVNRYIEPWSWIRVVSTMGKAQLMNFFKLRMSPDAHPNMQRLAVSMARVVRDSVPCELVPGAWHLPYVPLRMVNDPRYDHDKNIHWSVARCCWVSLNSPDKKTVYADAKRRHDDCVKYKHMTPLEHQLRAREDTGAKGCVPGFDQYRHMIDGESCSDFDYEQLLDTVYKHTDFLAG